MQHQKAVMIPTRNAADFMPAVCVACVQDGDSLVKEVQAEMETMRAQYQGVVTELQSKVSAEAYLFLCEWNRKMQR